MLDSWILSKLEPFNGLPLILLRDPQRMIQRGAHVVDGWAEKNGYTVLFCTGNLGLRDLYEPLRGAPGVRVLLVDRSRKDSDQPLFYPDLEAEFGVLGTGSSSSGRRERPGWKPLEPIELSLREFLVEATGDTAWPPQVEDRNLSRLLLANLPDALEAHSQLRQISPSRFSDSDLFRIILGAALKINPFAKLSPSAVRRLCIEQHAAIEEVSRYLPGEVMDMLRKLVASAPKPFCWLLDRDPEPLLRAFTLSVILRQHKLDYSLLLANLDPSLHEFREIDAQFLDEALKDELISDPERIAGDIDEVEKFLVDDPQRLAFLLRDRLDIDRPEGAFQALKAERLSPLIRSLALASLLIDLIQNEDLKFHREVQALLEKQESEPDLPALRRPTEQWEMLVNAYRRSLALLGLTGRLFKASRELQVKPAEALEFAEFERLWNNDRLNRLDFYISDLDRMLRVGDMLPVSHAHLWREFETRWDKARQGFKNTILAVEKALGIVNSRFQDLYRRHYPQWIGQPDSPAVFTHQFLPRLLKAHWDPTSGRKAVVLVFDGMRTDAWDEFLRPVLEERFEVIELRPGSAILPTETQLSRKAISAGRLPADFTIKSRKESELLKAWLRAEMGLNLSLEVIQDDDTTASGMTVRYASPLLDYIVFNFTDKNLHGNPHDLAFIYQSIVREIIRTDVRAVLRELPDDCLIFVTSDHGFTPFPSEPIDVSESVVADFNLVKYRVTRGSALFSGDDGKKVASFDIRALKIPIPEPPVPGQPIQWVHFPRPGYVFRRDRYRHNPDKYGHGGLSLAECLVPMVVLGPRQKDSGLLRIEAIQQTGSVSEGEPLEIELHVRAAQMVLQDLAIILTYNLKEVPTPRMEVFSGVEGVYRLSWTPILPEITPEQREAGNIQIPVTAVLTYIYNGKVYNSSRSADLRIKLDTTRLRRRLDSKLDLLMGKVPKELKG